MGPKLVVKKAKSPSWSMFHFQVFRRAEAKTFPVDRKGIKGRRKRGKKEREKGEQKKRENKLEMNQPKKKQSKFWLLRMRESKILYNLQQKLT